MRKPSKHKLSIDRDTIRALAPPALTCAGALNVPQDSMNCTEPTYSICFAGPGCYPT